MLQSLANWDKEEDMQVAVPSLPNAHINTRTSAVDDNEENGDLGESDSVSSDASTTQEAMARQVEAEAQQAASEVVKSTMKAVERDFPYTEKAITHKLDP